MRGNPVGDYIEISDIRPGADLVAEILRLLPPPAVRRQDDRAFPLIDLGAGVEMFVDECDDDRAVLAISGERVQTTVRRAAARRVFETLASGTAWSLRWTADDADGLIDGRFATGAAELRPGHLVLVSSR